MADSRIAGIEDDLRQQSREWELHLLVLNLQALKGISFLSAMTIAAETGDMRRFGTAEKLMSYYGLVPSERSSGKKEHRGRITRCGNSLVRRLLVEAAWHYRHRPCMSTAISQRCEGLEQKVIDIAWRAQKRLHKKYMHLQMNGKPMQKVCVAVARELAGFIWSIGREV
jgi:transposase